MNKRATFTGGFCLYLALALLIFPLKWLAAALLAAAFHELCHACAIRACLGKGTLVRVGIMRARMQLPPMHAAQELLCALAGPLGALLLLPLAPVCPRLAVYALVQSVYNLLPVYPLDGGRALFCAARLLLRPEYACWVCAYAQGLCLGALMLLSVYGAVFAGIGLAPLLAVGILAWRAGAEKLPCKPTAKALQ